jgi:hypothetical protein
MTVPVHNLYDFIHQVTKRQYWLLYFYPWGQKAITNLCQYQTDLFWLDGPNGIPPEARYPRLYNKKYNEFFHVEHFQPVILCHDQEPLNFELYNENSEFIKKVSELSLKETGSTLPPDLLTENLRLAPVLSVQKTWILLHSEINSAELKRYESTKRFQGAYWWSHAIIARDWYRYAKIDRALKHGKIKKIFLTYCRDTAGSRTYRKEFLQLIESNNLSQHCQLQSFNNVVISAESSAVYTAEDFNHTGISVVLETIFDQRIHLTEKILRAIACGHPFILAAGPGSLQLLRSYGFHTFHGYVNEEYDTITDHKERLGAIIKEMNRIASLPIIEQTALIETLRGIAAFNKQRFFSDEFFQQVVDELQRNVDTAFNAHLGELDFELWWKMRCYKKKQLGSAWKQIPNRNVRAEILVSLYRQQRLQQRINREQ